MLMFYFKGNQASQSKVGNRSRKNGHVRMLHVKIFKLKKKIQGNLARTEMFVSFAD